MNVFFFRIDLYNGLYKRASMCVRAAEYLDWFAFHAGVVGYYRDTSPIIIFNLINHRV